MASTRAVPRWPSRQWSHPFNGALRPMEHLPDEALAMHHTGPPIPRVRMVWEFSLAVVMQAAQVAAMMVALVYWFVSNANRGEDNQRRLAEFQTNVSGQITELIQCCNTGKTAGTDA